MNIKIKTLVLICFVVLPLLAQAQAQTKPGDKLQMQCGEHLIVLTCGYSDEIAKRQRSRPRLCNDNTLEFIAKDGSKRSFTTFNKGQHRDKTPIRASCISLLPIKLYQVSVLTDDTAWGFIAGFSEDGKRYNDDNGNTLDPKNRPKYKIDYTESKTIQEIRIKENR